MKPLAIANLLTATTEDRMMYRHASFLYMRFVKTMRNLIMRPPSGFELDAITDSLNANLFVAAYSWHRVNGEIRFKRHG
jgi:hypothetical protein